MRGHVVRVPLIDPQLSSVTLLIVKYNCPHHITPHLPLFSSSSSVLFSTFGFFSSLIKYQNDTDGNQVHPGGDALGPSSVTGRAEPFREAGIVHRQYIQSLF